MMTRFLSALKDGVSALTEAVTSPPVLAVAA
jgi:hypothetical protein